jgi:hypothetical protein
LAWVDVFETRDHISLLKHFLLFYNEILQGLLRGLNALRNLYLVAHHLWLQLLLLRLLLVIQRDAVDLHLHGTDIVHIKLEALFVRPLLGLLIVFMGVRSLASGNLSNIDAGDANPGDVSETSPPEPLLLYSIDLSSPSVLLN